jgi:hypothetical protein
MKLIRAFFFSLVSARPRRLFDDRQFIAEPGLDIVDDPVAADDFLEFLFTQPEKSERYSNYKYQPENVVETDYRPIVTLDDLEFLKQENDLELLQRENDLESLKQALRRLDNNYYGFEEREPNRRF